MTTLPPVNEMPYDVNYIPFVTPKNLHELIGSIPFYSALFLTGANLHANLYVHAYNTYEVEQCRPCARFLEMYNGDFKNDYRVRPRHPACSRGIMIIRGYLKIPPLAAISEGRHERVIPEAA